MSAWKGDSGRPRNTWSRAARAAAAARVQGRFYVCPFCAKRSLAKWAYDTKAKAVRKYCRWCDRLEPLP